MFDDLSKEIKSQLYEKAKGPLFFTFSVSWIAYNIRGISVAFSELPVAYKFIQWDLLYPDFWSSFNCFFLFPFFTATAIIITYPLPARWAYHYWHWQYQKVKKIQQKIEDETPLTIEESRDIRKKGLELEVELQDKIHSITTTNSSISAENTRLKAELVDTKSKQFELESSFKDCKAQLAANEMKLSSLQDEITKRDNQIAEITKGNNKLQNKITTLEIQAEASKNLINQLQNPAEDPPDSQEETVKSNLLATGLEKHAIRVFMDLVDSGGRLSINSYIDDNPVSSMEIEYGIDRLTSRDLAHKIQNNATLSITEKGRSLAVESGLTEYLKHNQYP